jgi:hypothetical protein
VPKHVKFGFFEPYEISRHALAKNAFGVVWLDQKNNCLCWHEGANFNGMIAASKLVVNYETLSVIDSFLGTCFRHAFFKACQHSIYDERMSKGLKYVSIKLAQANLQKCIT